MGLSMLKLGYTRAQFSAHCYSFIMFKALSRKFRKALPMELLYSEESLRERVRIWKEGMEKKGLRVNAGKTKIMWCKVSSLAGDSGEHSCGVCRKG